MKRTYRTLGDIAEELQRMREDGMSRESIELVVGKVFDDAGDFDPDAPNFPPPKVIPVHDTVLMLAQHFAEGRAGDGKSYDIVLAGAKLEAAIYAANGKRIRRERIDIMPILSYWITHLLNRKD